MIWHTPNEDPDGDWHWVLEDCLPRRLAGTRPVRTRCLWIYPTLEPEELREVSPGVAEDVYVETEENEDVPQEVIEPPQIEGILQTELLVKCFHGAVDYLIEQDWNMCWIISFLQEKVSEALFQSEIESLHWSFSITGEQGGAGEEVVSLKSEDVSPIFVNFVVFGSTQSTVSGLNVSKHHQQAECDDLQFWPDNNYNVNDSDNNFTWWRSLCSPVSLDWEMGLKAVFGHLEIQLYSITTNLAE